MGCIAGIDDSGRSCHVVIPAGKESGGRHTGVVPISFHDYVALEIELRFVREHLCADIKHDNEPHYDTWEGRTWYWHPAQVPKYLHWTRFMSRSSELGTSTLIRSAREYILACLYTRARTTSPGNANGTTTTHGRSDEGTRASPSPVQASLRQRPDRYGEGCGYGRVCIDVEVGTYR